MLAILITIATTPILMILIGNTITSNNGVKPEKETSHRLEHAEASRFNHFVANFQPNNGCKSSRGINNCIRDTADFNNLKHF